MDESDRHLTGHQGDKSMNTPGREDFLAAFGLEPAEEDALTALCRYVVIRGDQELELSFSAVTDSVHVLLRVDGRECVNFLSESVQSVDITNDARGPGVRLVIEAPGEQAEGFVGIDTAVHFHYRRLRT